jgi:hypothetical protein
MSRYIVTPSQVTLTEGREGRSPYRATDLQAIVVNTDGLSVFDLIRYRYHDYAAVLCGFDPIELEGEDLRRQPIERHKAVLADLLRDTRDGIAFNEHFEGDGRIADDGDRAAGITRQALGIESRTSPATCFRKHDRPTAISAPASSASEPLAVRRVTVLRATRCMHLN